jgi:hypothetical protein
LSHPGVNLFLHDAERHLALGRGTKLLLVLGRCGATRQDRGENENALLHIPI